MYIQFNFITSFINFLKPFVVALSFVSVMWLIFRYFGQIFPVNVTENKTLNLNSSKIFVLLP